MVLVRSAESTATTATTSITTVVVAWPPTRDSVIVWKTTVFAAVTTAVLAGIEVTAMDAVAVAMDMVAVATVVIIPVGW